MIGFKIWSRFGVFRDPLTITQNITFPIPPKTTIGGIMAALLSIDYNNYFRDPEYFSFGYSVVPLKPIRKKSFAQNYIDDYTKRSSTKLSELVNILKMSRTAVSKIAKKFTSPKPIFRELLCEPSYLVFVNNYKYEEKLKQALQEHTTGFAIYMGNSEFPANVKNVPVKSYISEKATFVDSFSAFPELIEFEVNKRYTNLHFASKVIGEREYSEYKKIVFSESGVLLQKPVDTIKIITEKKTYVCEFI